jgi:hypothetical protein
LAGENSREHELETIGGILPAFDREHLTRVEGASASASDICAALQAWCTKHGVKVPSQKRLGLYLAGLGFRRWKRNGNVHYQHVRLKAREPVRPRPVLGVHRNDDGSYSPLCRSYGECRATAQALARRQEATLPKPSLRAAATRRDSTLPTTSS